jgi:hypothetical protein
VSEWTLQLQIRDLGEWKPDDPTAAAALIAAVNAERKPGNDRPKVGIGRNGRDLRVNLDDTTLWLDPGEHLIRAESSRRVMWSGVPADELDDLR